MTQAEKVKVSGTDIKVSNPDKVLFDEGGLTKGDLAEYYLAVAGRMLPYLRGRPLVMMRYPDGISGEGIVQKNAPDYFPDWIRRTALPRRDGGSVCHVVCDDAATLIYLAGQACIEAHMMLAQADTPEHPDQLVFDLDPPDGADGFAMARRTALRLRDLLEDELHLTTFVKTTGGSGLHVHVPLNGQATFNQVRGFARAVGEILQARKPDDVTTSQRKDSRRGRLYLDVMRNAFAQTVIAPYAVRARQAALVAMPVSWEEVGQDSMTPQRFTMSGISARLDQISGRSDPWHDYGRHRHDIGPAQRRLAAVYDGED